MKKSVGSMARQFITGRTGADAVPVLKKIRSRGVGFTVDILGEAVVSEKEAEEYYHRYLGVDRKSRRRSEALAALRATRRRTDGGARCRRSTCRSRFPRCTRRFIPADPEGAIAQLKERLRPLFRRAKELGVFINLDMENYGLKNLTI